MCPNCGAAMVPGRLRVKGTAPGFFFFGMSWQHLWWTDQQESRASRKRLIASGDGNAGHRCEACGFVAFRPVLR